jgi:hypothetical protein
MLTSKLIRADNPTYKYISEDEQTGLYHTLPKPFKLSSMEKFIHQFKAWSPEYMQYRQVLIEGDSEATETAQIFYFSNCAFALVMSYSKQNNGKYEYTHRVYEVGCDHDWKELGQKEAQEKGHIHFGNCYHVMECPKCNMVTAYDSSG